MSRVMQSYLTCMLTAPGIATDPAPSTLSKEITRQPRSTSVIVAVKSRYSDWHMFIDIQESFLGTR